MKQFANSPKPPYYAVIFTSILSSDIDGYESTAEKMISLALNQSGFLGVESARNEIGITVSYWSDLESISKWKNQLDHIQAQTLGKEKWYSSYKVRISRVEKEYSFPI